MDLKEMEKWRYEAFLNRARELKTSVSGNYDSSIAIQDETLVDWLIEQAEKVERYENALKEIVEAPEDIMLSEHSRLADRVAKEALSMDD